MTQTPKDWNLVSMEEDRDFWKCEFEREKARADAAEQREQQLKEAVIALLTSLEDNTPNELSEEIRIKELLRTLYPDTPAPTPKITARPIEEWHEDMGCVIWWEFPISEPPHCGTPLDMDWPGYHTHWTTIVIPAAPAPKEGDTE